MKELKYRTYNELKQKKLNNATKKEKGDIFELLTKYYLLINPIYQTKLNKVWLLNEVPTEIKTYLNLPDNDEGIDLIAQTKDNEYWAIQCKYRTNEDSSITRDDISTFLDISTNICKNISHKLVCTTAHRQSYKFDKFYDDKITFLLADTWNDLGEDFFNKIEALVNKKPINIEPFKPKEHQTRAIQNAHNHFESENNSRGKLIMACGSGKSLTAYWIAQKLEAKTILIAVPSLALIKQTLEVWTRESVANNIDINWLAVCSDESVSNSDDDIFMTSTKDLGIDVTTDIDEIALWLQDRQHNTTIVFTTYQSSKTIAEASKIANITYDFGIMDEAHKTVGVKDSLFSHLLFDENMDINKRLFMTATERRYKGNSDDIISMDNIALYGEDFEVLTFREALESNPPILCDYKIIAMMVTKKEIASYIENNNYLRLQNENYTKEVEAEMLASTVALHKARKKYNIKHTISFHSSIERAKLFKNQEETFRESFTEYIDLDTFHVSGQTPTAKRNKIINEFSNSKNSLITNARCLTEGVDVPNIDCVLFADPRQSTVDIVQAVGRALRLAEDKEFGYVLVPILIDDENIDIGEIKNKSFQSVIDILRALASSDDRIIDYFQTKNNPISSNGGNIICLDIPPETNIDIAEFNNSINLSIMPKIKDLKVRPFEEAREFVRGLNLKNEKEWTLYCQNELKDKELKPIDIPSSPRAIYKLNGWKNIKDWLGTTSDLKYLPFEEAREFVHGLNIGTNKKDWENYWKEHDIPDFIPIQPNQRYQRSFKGRFLWKNFLGTDLMPFEEAKEFVKKLNLKDKKEWIIYCKGKILALPPKPDNIPRDPDGRYRKEWNGWEDFIGLENAKINGEYREFEEAREFVRSLGLNGQVEWKKYAKGKLDGYEAKPNDIPTAPSSVYGDEYNGIADWLGYEKKMNKPKKGANFEDTYIPFDKAKEFARSLNLRTSLEWKDYCNGKRDDLPTKLIGIPTSPDITYKKYGIEFSWIDWLGNSGKISKKNTLPFKEAREFVRSLGLKNTNEWIDYKKGKLEHLEPIPNNIPKSPHNVYKNDGWIGMRDWLGNE